MAEKIRTPDWARDDGGRGLLMPMYGPDGKPNTQSHGYRSFIRSLNRNRRRMPIAGITEVTDPWSGVADALAHTDPADRVTLVEPRSELDI